MINTNLLDELKKLLKWKKSAAFYAQKLGVSEDEVLHLIHTLKTIEYLPKMEEEEIKLVSEKVNGDERQIEYRSSTPLSRQQIEELYGIDGITTTLSTYWNKELPSGKYIVSANVKCHTEGISKEELVDSLRAIFPKDISSYVLPPVEDREERLLTILISDDHCGMINETNIFDAADYTPQEYEKRLLKIVSVIKNSGNKFEEVRVISLGDQTQGWNKQTTRGGHIVNGVSNKEQFEFYTKGRVAFYEALFSSGVGEHYFVHEMDNSNHSGLGFSYMANQYLAMFLEARFPQVTFTSHDAMIDGFEYGEHLIVFAHGKDEKFQKRAMPYNINERTDLYIYDWLSTHGYNPAKVNASFYKGDLHAFGLQMGKFGRYVNIPAISGNSDYGDLNFGNTRAGVLLEIYSKKSNTIITSPIWM